MSTFSTTPARKIRKLEARLVRHHRKLGELKRRRPPEPVEDYALIGPGGPVKLSALFDGHCDLIIVHNMGRRCPYCTMWADGYNGLRPHLENRAAFAVVSPDSLKVQQAFAQSRGWGAEELLCAETKKVERGLRRLEQTQLPKNRH